MALRLQASLDHLATYCARVGATVETLTYAEQRDALVALGVEVRVWHGGTHRPRWNGRMQPLGMPEPIICSDICCDLGATPVPAAATNEHHVGACSSLVCAVGKQEMLGAGVPLVSEWSPVLALHVVAAEVAG